MGADSSGWKILHGILGVALHARRRSGAFVQPKQAFWALASVLGFLLLLMGLFEIIAAVATKDVNPLWWLGLIAGILFLVLAFWASQQLVHAKGAALPLLRRPDGDVPRDQPDRVRVRPPRTRARSSASSTPRVLVHARALPPGPARRERRVTLHSRVAGRPCDGPRMRRRASRRGRKRSSPCSPRGARSRRPTSSRSAARVVDTEIYDEADVDFEGFWARQAAELLDWFEEWDTVLEWDLPFAKWFVGGTAQRVVQLPRPPRRRRSRRAGRVPLGG